MEHGYKHPMMVTLFLALILTNAWGSQSGRPKSVSEFCAEYLGTDVHYSFVLQGDGSYAWLSHAKTSPKSSVPIGQVLKDLPDRDEVLKHVPQLAELEWLKQGNFAYSATTHFVGYQIRGGEMTMELTLPSNVFGQDIVRHLLQTLERENVSAMVSGLRTHVSVYRLALSDLATQRALNDFMSFMKTRELNP